MDYKKICEIVRDDKPTLMVGTPSFFWGYLRKSEPGDFASLRLALCGADKCPDALREGFMEKHNMVLYEAYGTTETSPGISGNAEGLTSRAVSACHSKGSRSGLNITRPAKNAAWAKTARSWSRVTWS